MGLFTQVLDWVGLGRQERLAVPAHAVKAVSLRGERPSRPPRHPAGKSAPHEDPVRVAEGGDDADPEGWEEGLRTLADPIRREDVQLTDQEAWFQSAVRIVRHEAELPVLPDTALRVMRQVDRPTVNYARLADLIETDPILTAELLRTANSATYRGLQPIVSVGTAACRMGARNLRRWLLWFSVRFTVFKRGGTGSTGRRLWRHLVLTAEAARALGEVAGGDPDQLFLGGLFHDFGKIMALAAVERVLRDDKISRTPRREALDAILKEDHEKLGAQIVASWGLPPGVAAAAEFHTFPRWATREEAVVKRVALANVVAHARERGYPLGPTELAILDAETGVLPEESQRVRYAEILAAHDDEAEAFV